MKGFLDALPVCWGGFSNGITCAQALVGAGAVTVLQNRCSKVEKCSQIPAWIDTPGNPFSSERPQQFLCPNSLTDNLRVAWLWIMSDYTGLSLGEEQTKESSSLSPNKPTRSYSLLLVVALTSCSPPSSPGLLRVLTRSTWSLSSFPQTPACAGPHLDTTFPNGQLPGGLSVTFTKQKLPINRDVFLHLTTGTGKWNFSFSDWWRSPPCCWMRWGCGSIRQN